MTAVASATVIMILIVVPVRMVLVPALDFDWGITVSAVISMLLSALIVGYIFAGKIAEARLASIAKITVFSAIVLMFFAVNLSALGDWTPVIKEAYQEANPGTTLSTSEWLAVENIATINSVFLNMVYVLVLGFIGFYVGSRLRKPSKS
jgi:hypothetical protein